MKKDMRKEIYFMVDIESDGPIPGKYNMNSFGAVPFAIKNDETTEYFDVLSLEDNFKFYRELKPVTDNFIPEAIAVGGFTHEQLAISGTDPQTAMEEFNAWLTASTKALGGNLPVFAAYPLGFDWMFTYWYQINFTGTSPFGHSRHKDLKTEYATKTGRTISGSVKSRMPKHLFSEAPHTHNALDDAVEQALLAQNIMRWNGQ